MTRPLLLVRSRALGSLRVESGAQLGQAEAHAALDGAERQGHPARDLLVRQAAEEGEPNDLPLGRRDELVEREVQARGAWVRDTFGERPDGLRAGQVWQQSVRLAARYRVEHDITDPGDALGPRPEQREEQRGWERARRAIARDQRQLGRDLEVELDVDLALGF